VLGCHDIMRLSIGVRKDYTETIRWYRKAADQGHAKAQTVLGYMYDDGLGVPKDYAEAVRWYRKAADQGLPEAQHALGNSYFSGQGVPQDCAAAKRWYQKAADQGVGYSQRMLGLLHIRGFGVPKALYQGDAVGSEGLPIRGFLKRSMLSASCTAAS